MSNNLGKARDIEAEKKKVLGSLEQSVNELERRASEGAYPDTSAGLKGLGSRLNQYYDTLIGTARHNFRYRIAGIAISAIAGAGAGFGMANVDPDNFTGAMRQITSLGIDPSYFGSHSAFVEQYSDAIRGGIAGLATTAAAYFLVARPLINRAKTRGMEAARRILDGAKTSLYRAQGSVGMPDSIGDLEGTVLQQAQAVVDLAGIRLGDIKRGENASAREPYRPQAGESNVGYSPESRGGHQATGADAATMTEDMREVIGWVDVYKRWKETKAGLKEAERSSRKDGINVNVVGDGNNVNVNGGQ